MAASDAERARRYRDKQRGGPPRSPAPHGTAAAIKRHERDAEPLCDACRLERNRIQREKYAARRARS